MQTTFESCGRFEALELLGEGATAQVFKARDPGTGTIVALKRLKSGSPEAHLRFEQEYRLQARLNHPNLCAAHEFGIASDGTPFMVMELVEGTGLDALLPISVNDVLPLFTQLAHGLNYLHQQGLVHGDLKPENIRCGSDGTLKLIDFGLLVQSGQRAGTVQGSLHYLSPEIAREQPVDGRSDVYAVGAILYELLTGARAIDGETVLEVLRNHVSQEPQDLSERVPNLPVALGITVMKMLAKDPGARPVSILAALAGCGVNTDVVYPNMLLAPPLLEREGCLAELESCVLAVKESGHGELVQILGPAGSGKTRLLSELQYLSSVHGLPIARVDCGVETGPYGPLVAAVRQWLPLLDTHCPEVIAEAAPALAFLIPELARDGGASDRDMEQPQYLIQSGLSRLLIKAATLKGGVLILDNAYAMAADVHDTLGYMLRNATGLGHSDAGNPDNDSLAQVPLLLVFAGEEGLQYPGRQLDLCGLSRDAIQRLLASRLGQADIPEAWSQRLFDLTAGNPGWLNAVLENAFAQGNLQRAGASWFLPKPFASTDLSSELRLRLVKRKESLSADSRQLAEEAAVLGYGWCLSELMSVTTLDTATMLDTLMQLGAAGLITQSPTGYAWQSLAVRDLYYGDIAPERLPELHHRVAHMLLNTRVNGQKLSLQQNLELAEHGLMAQIPDAATDWVLTVMADGFGILPYQSLLGLLRRGLALLDARELTDTERLLRVDYLRWMAHTHRSGHELTEAEACLREGLGLLEDRNEPERECRLCNTFGQVCDLRGGAGDKVLAEGYFARAIELAGKTSDHAELAYTLIARGRSRLLSGRTRDAITDLTEGHQTALTAGKPFQAARALALLGYAQVQLGQSADAGCAQVASAIVEQGRLGDHYGESYSLGLLGNIKLEQGAYLDASEAFARQVDIVRALGVVDDLIVGLISLAEAQLGLGALNDVIANAELAERASGEHAHILGKLVTCALLGLAHALRGEVPAALSRLTFAEQAALERTAIDQLIGLSYVIDGWLALGLPRRADNTLHQALFTLRAVESPMLSLRYQLLQARVLVARDQHKAAAPILETVCQEARAMQNWGVLALALVEQGFVKLKAGDTAAAQADADAAQALILESSAQVTALRLKALWAEIETRTGDPSRARVYYQSVELSASDMNVPLAKALALHGQSLQEERPSRAKSMLTAAQRLLDQHASQLDDSLREDFRLTSWVAEILEARPSHPNRQERTDQKGSDFGSVVLGMQATLDSLTSWHESEVTHLTQYQDRLMQLLDGTSRLGLTLNRNDVHRECINLALRVSGAERGYLVTKQPGRYADLVCQLALNHEGQAIDTSYSLSICQRVLASNNPLLVLDTSGDSEFSAAKSILALSIRSVMCVPLGPQDTPFGVLYVDSSAVVTHFTEPDLRLLQLLASHASRALRQVDQHETFSQRIHALEAGNSPSQPAVQLLHDDLTRLPHRAVFLDFASREIALAKRYSRPFTVSITAVDNLKFINDRYGRQVGDAVLRAFSQILSEQQEEGVMAARLGGKEFVLLVTLDAPCDAETITNRILKASAALELKDAAGNPVPVPQLATGLTQWEPDDDEIGDMLYRINLGMRPMPSS